MAIFHHSTSIIKRSSGKSAISAAAYRSGEKITDYKSGNNYDYTRKSGVDYSVILSPVPAINKNAWLKNRSELWNLVEAEEKRADAQLAREVTIAIPVELSRENKIDLVKEYVQSNYVDRGMIADINFHHLNGNNPHVHIMLTMRELIVEDGSARFGNKNRSWNDKNLATEYRKNWEVIANRYLSEAGKRARIDCRTLEAQGIIRVPQIHLGAKASAMKSKNIKTDRGDIYNQVDGRNFNIRSWEQSALAMKQRIEPPKTRSTFNRDRTLALENISNLDRAIADIDRQIQEIESNLVKELDPEPSEVFIKLDPSEIFIKLDPSEIFIKLDPEPGEVWIELDPEPAEVSRQEQNYNRGFGR